MYNAGLDRPARRRRSSATGQREDFDAVMHTNVLGPMRGPAADPAVRRDWQPRARRRAGRAVLAHGHRIGAMDSNRRLALPRQRRPALNAGPEGRVSLDAPCDLRERCIPGWVQTDMGGAAQADLDAATQRDRPAPHAGRPEAGATTAAFHNYDGTPLPLVTRRGDKDTGHHAADSRTGNDPRCRAAVRAGRHRPAGGAVGPRQDLSDRLHKEPGRARLLRRGRAGGTGTGRASTTCRWR